MAKEAFKNFVEILLYLPIPKKLAVSLGVASVLRMTFSPRPKEKKELIMKEVLKNVGKILLYSPVPKYLSIPVGIVASGIMSIVVTNVAGKVFRKKKSLTLLNIGDLLTHILALGCFAGLAVTSLTSRFNVLPKPVVGGLLLLTGGAEALLYSSVLHTCLNSMKENNTKIRLASLLSITITAAGGVYLAREGFNLLSSSK